MCVSVYYISIVAYLIGAQRYKEGCQLSELFLTWLYIKPCDVQQLEMAVKCHIQTHCVKVMLCYGLLFVIFSAMLKKRTKGQKDKCLHWDYFDSNGSVLVFLSQVWIVTQIQVICLLSTNRNILCILRWAIVFCSSKLLQSSNSHLWKCSKVSIQCSPWNNIQSIHFQTLFDSDF